MKFRVGLFLCAVAGALAAQAARSPQSSYKSFGFDTISRSTLDLSFAIPIFNRPTGVNAQVGLVLAYDRAVGWRLETPSGSTTTDNWDNGTCGWYDPVTGVDDDNGAPDTATYDIQVNVYIFNEPDGTSVQVQSALTLVLVGNQSHPRGWVTDCPDAAPPVNEAVPGGKGYYMTFIAGVPSVYDQAGERVDGAFTDLYGNQVTNTVSGNTTKYFDPLSASNGSAPAVTVTSVSATEITYGYTGPNGSPATITETLNGAGLPASLAFPDGSTYSFGYDANNQVNQVTLPTTGVVHWDYGLTNGNLTLTRWDSLNGASQAWNWTLTETQPAGTSSLTEVSPAGDRSVFNFNIPPPVPTQDAPLTSVYYYQGNPGAELMHTVIANNVNFFGVVGQDIETTLPGATTLYSERTTTLDERGITTSENDYDWWSQTPVLLHTVTTTTVATANGNGEQRSYVDLADSQGTVQSAVSYGYSAQGQMTSSAQGYGGINLTTQYAFNSNGTVASVTDSNGAVTSYTYGAGGCGTFPTEVKSAAIPAAEDTTMVWDCTGGVMTSSTDVNHLTTSTDYHDPANVWRPHMVTAPDGTVTTLSYLSPAGSPTQVESATPFNGTVSTADVLTTLDSLGRPVLTQKRQGPGSAMFDTVQTFYDSMGRATGTSLPCPSSAGVVCGTPATTTTFDALSRPLKVTDAGGGETDYGYVQNDTLITVVGSGNSLTVNKQEEFDGLGRLTSVCEIRTKDEGGGACGQTSPQTGYWTTYTRNPAGQITQVVQDAQGAPAQTRSFTFDSVGRITSETNPESGNTRYWYDADSNCGQTSAGDLVKRIDANGNETCYAHDALHRVTQVGYGGPNAAVTPFKNFVYDADPGWSLTNTAGRLAEAYTGPAGARMTRDVFGYDAAGRSTDDYQYLADTGLWHDEMVGYFADGAPETLTYIPGVPTLTYGLDGEGRPTTLSAASGQNPVTAGAYNQPVAGLLTNTFTLGSGDADAYTFDPNTGRMTQYQFTVNGATDTGQLAWNKNGTLNQMAIADNIPGTADTQTCNYTQDDLGRIASVGCGAGWQQTFSFDPFGNLTKTGNQSFQAAYFDANGNNTNRIVTNINVSGNYDSDGNLLNDPVQSNTNVNTFDAEGKPVTLEGVNVTYDALGRAVEAAGQQFLYSPTGAKLAVMNGSTLVRADIPLPGGGVAGYGPGGLEYYAHSDWEGSSRLQTTPSRTLWWSNAVAPYGEAYSAGAAQYFTGMTSDIDATHSGGQRDFLMREYSPLQGRWWSPDPAGVAAADPGNPQTWNRYAYVENTPMNRIDPSGLCDAVIGGSTQSPGTDDTSFQESFADQIGAVTAFPFAGQTLAGSVGSIEMAALGSNNAAVQTASAAISYAAANSPGPFTVYAFSGGAQAAWSALGRLPASVQARATVVDIAPGFGVGFQHPSATLDITGGGAANTGVNLTADVGFLNSQYGEISECGHNANCLFASTSDLLSQFSTGACPSHAPFTRSGGGGKSTGGGGDVSTGGGYYTMWGISGEIGDILAIYFYSIYRYQQ